MIKAIIFDFGNVIGFFDHRMSMERLARHTPFSADALLRFIYGTELDYAYETGQISSEEFLRRVRDGCQLRCSDEDLGNIYSDIFWPNEDVCRLVPRLKPHHKLLVGSNTTELHTQKFLRQFADVLSHFDAVVTSWEIRARKPQREFFHHCQRLAGCEAQECVFIDDIPVNVAGAQACGWHGLVYSRGDNLEQRLAELGVQVNGFGAST
jgi:putative hydrolase of the HAD superfamily